MISEFNRMHTINGFAMDFCGVENDKLSYCYYYDPAQKMRTATFQPCEWAKHSHGNPPAGTLYGYFKIQLPDGRRANYNVYI